MPLILTRIELGKTPARAASLSATTRLTYNPKVNFDKVRPNLGARDCSRAVTNDEECSPKAGGGGGMRAA